MILEQLIFTIFAFALFVLIFFRVFRKNDTNYITVLVMQAIGITLNFIAVFAKKEFGIFFIILKYLLGILIPVAILVIEKKGIPLIQLVSVTKAKIYLKVGNNKKAKEQLINLVTKYPENYIGHKMLAEVYEQEGGMRKAIDEYVQAVDANKQDYDSYYKIAELLTGLDKQDEAAEMLFNLLHKKPDCYKATELLGDILINKQMYKEAVNIYQDALKYNPLSFDLNYNLGIAYTMLNDFQNAKICYEKAAEINSLSYNSKYSLAEISLIYKELKKKKKYFMQVIDDEYLAADSYYELSKIAMVKNDKEKAIQYANVAIDLDAGRVVPKIKKDPIFIPVLARISIPFNIEPEKENENMTEKEKVAKAHLEDMFEITRNLSYSDIKMLKNSQNEMNENQIQQNYYDRERE